MPQFILEIPNCEETISNPIITSILTRIIRTYKWYEEFDFKFLNLSESIIVKGSELDLPKKDRSQQRLTTDTTVEVEISERYNEEMTSAQAIREKTQQNIFFCDKTKVNMHPGYQQMIIDLSMKFRFSTRHQAENFRKRVRLASTKSVDGMLLEVRYNYTIPYQFIYLLKHIHELMENNHGYGIDFGTWLRSSFTKNLTTLSNQAGGQSVLAIAEINTGVLVLVSSPDQVPGKEKDNEEDAYSVTLEFEVIYDRPDVMRMKIPHVVHNQPIDFKYLNRFKPLKTDQTQSRTHISTLDAIKAGAIPFGDNVLSGAVSPHFDDWLPPYFERSYPDALRCLIGVDEDDRKNTLDLKDIADWDLSPATLGWLADTRDTIQKQNFNILWFRLWEWDKCQSLEILELTEDLKLRTKEELDPRKNYHLTIGMCIEPDILDKSVWDKLKDHPDFLEEWILIIAPEFKDKIDDFFEDYYDKWKDTSEDGWHDNGSQWGGNWDDMPDWIIKEIEDQLKEWASKGVEQFKHRTVMMYGVFARRKGVDYDA